MKVLVINCGSSTMKFQLIETEAAPSNSTAGRRLARGIVEGIGGTASCRFEAAASAPVNETIDIGDYEQAAVAILDWLKGHSHLGSVDAVGHRVVHGGNHFNSAVRIDEIVMDSLESLCELAPLHNPAAIQGIRALRKAWGPAIAMVAVFDTTFHQTLPAAAATYAIPYEISIAHGIRRYGFHGLAHQYSLMRYCELRGVAKEQASIVTLHLGNGCSATAIRGGKSVDTSMGFTPLEGLVMGTRCGDLDPALADYIAIKEGVSSAEVQNWLNQRSGLLGVSGVASDMRQLLATMDSNPRSRLAVEVFCYRARKYLGAYLAALGGADAVAFSGGIGENAPLVREKVCEDMGWCGLLLDAQLNRSLSDRDRRISPDHGALAAYVIHTDEETLVAHETARLVAGAGEQKKN